MNFLHYNCLPTKAAHKFSIFFRLPAPSPPNISPGDSHIWTYHCHVKARHDQPSPRTSHRPRPPLTARAQMQPRPGPGRAVSFHSRGPLMQRSCAPQSRYIGSLPWDRKVPCLRHAGASPVPYQQSHSCHCHTGQILMSRPAIFSPGSPGHCPAQLRAPSSGIGALSTLPPRDTAPPHTHLRGCVQTRRERKKHPPGSSRESSFTPWQPLLSAPTLPKAKCT